MFIDSPTEDAVSNEHAAFTDAALLGGRLSDAVLDSPAETSPTSRAQHPTRPRRRIFRARTSQLFAHQKLAG
jgi:hypothetical protein